MGTDEQLNLDFAVERTEWGKWVDPDRRAAQVRKFMEYAGLHEIPSRPWPQDWPDTTRLNTLFAGWLPNMDTATEPENHDMVDALVCFIGECFIRFAGAHWIDWQSWDDEYSFYDHVNPAVECDTHDEDEIGMWAFIKRMTEYHPGDHDGIFSYFTAALREYATYHQEKREDSSQ